MATERPALTYPEVGATAGELPAGYHHVHAERVVGRGPEGLAAAGERLLTWGMHTSAGLRLVDGPPRAAVGRDVHLTWLAGLVQVRCRVVDVVQTADRVGFAYGTLPGHAVTGEERFEVLLREDGVVVATVVAFSRPASATARLAGPGGRLVQQLMAGRYLRALRVGTQT